MSIDLTTLKFKIDTSDVPKAQRDLNNLAKSGQGAEASIKAAGKAASDSGRNFSQFSGVSASLSKRLEGVASSADGAGLRSDAYASGFEELSSLSKPFSEYGFGSDEQPEVVPSGLVSATTTPAKGNSGSSNLYDKLKGWSEDAQKGLKDYAATAENIHKAVGDLFSKSMNQMGDALYNFVQTGKLDFSSLANSIVADLARITFNSQVLGPLANALASGIGSLFSSSITSGDQAGMAAGHWSQGGNWHALGDVMHGPGISAYSSSVIDYPTRFWADGGNLMGEAGPEGILPLKRMSNGKLGVHSTGDGGGSNVTVNVIDQRANGGDVKTRESRGPNGRQIDVYVVDAVNRALRTGAFDRSMESNFGIARAGAR